MSAEVQQTAWTAERCANLLAKAKRSPTGWKGCCPAHEDKEPSLFLADGQDGLALVCYAGCDYRSIADALEAKGAVLKASGGARERKSIFTEHFQLGAYHSHWDYRDAMGRVVLRVCRWEQPGGNKDIRPLTKTADGWKWGHHPTPRPLFQLDRLTNDPEKPVIVVEGEKTAVAAQKLFPDHIATTWPGGAAATRQADIGPLKDRDVTLIPDCDAPGRNAMALMHNRLKASARSARIIDPGQIVKDLPDGWDLADALAENRDVSAWLATSQESSAQDDEPIELLALDLDAILKPVPPERYLVSGVPCDAYTLIAGALSSYKSTLLLYMIIWRATGYDFLNLDKSGIGGNIGPAVLIFYEDTDKRMLARLHRILQSGYAKIEVAHGKRSACEFLERAAQNIRRIAFTGCFRKTIVTRVAGMVLPNETMIDELFAKIRDFTTSDIFIGLDPLRLAIVGSQNDDDGADVVVHTFNRMAVELPDSGLVVTSHTTKTGAQDPAEGYTGKSYATSGSALYSQHARSNFHVARIKPEEIEQLFDPIDVPADEYARQPVAQLTHGRLSHGPESQECYFKMSKGGILVPLKTRQPRSAFEISDSHLPLVVSVIDDIHEKKRLAPKDALEADERLTRRVGGRDKIRLALGLMVSGGYIEFVGKTTDRDCKVTDKGRTTTSRESPRKTPEIDP